MQLKNDKKNNLIIAALNIVCALFMFAMAIAGKEWFLAVVGVAFLFVSADRLSRIKKLMDAEKKEQSHEEKDQ